MTAEVVSTLERAALASWSSLETCFLREVEEDVAEGELRALISCDVFFDRSLAKERVKSWVRPFSWKQLGEGGIQINFAPT